MRDIDYERYECWTAARRRTVKLIHYAGSGGEYIVPEAIRGQGPWTDARRGLVTDLKPEHRLGLARDGYVLLQLEAGRRGVFSPEVEKGGSAVGHK